MDNSFPFSLAFGPAENREVCIESAQRVYERLMIRNQGHEKLSFDTIAVVAIDKNGVIDQKKMKNLIRIFRPDKEGELSLLDFVRCCDMVYKSLRLLRASISNSGQIDRGFESIMNWAFYTVLVCIILAANGFNPLALFLSFSSVLLAFAFVIGSASSKYFEGILFILVRRPYDIGDRIAIADVNSETSINGTLTWFVQKVNLYTTTVRYSGTNEGKFVVALFCRAVHRPLTLRVFPYLPTFVIFSCNFSKWLSRDFENYQCCSLAKSRRSCLPEILGRRSVCSSAMF